MKNIRYQNEKVKRRYFEWSQGVEGYSDKTMKVKESALWKYDDFHKHQDYKKFNAEIAKGFKKYLQNYKTKKGDNLSLTTVYSIIRHVNAFFKWLSTQSGYKSKIRLDDVAYLRLSKKENRIATSSKMPKYPSLDYIRKICSFEVTNDIDMRDRALIAFTALSGMRDLAIVTLPIGCFDKKKLLVEQLPEKGVQTKFSKTIYTTLFNFDSKLLQYVLDWEKYLRKEMLFDDTKPMFPSTRIEQVGEFQHSFIAKGVSKEFWSDAGPMRTIFKKRAKQMGFEYYSPHKFRHFAINQANKSAKGAEQMKAISQNVGHEHLTTTFRSYGAIDTYRVSDIIGGMDFTED